MAGRRPAPAPPKPDGLTWHPSLECGPCVEVWWPERTSAGDPLDRAISARRRWSLARRAWLQATRELWEPAPDARPRWAVSSSGPWAFTWLADRDPVALADRLAYWNLPGDWTPTPAPALLRSLKPYEPPSPTAVALLIGE